MTELEILQKALERERAARKEAEQIIEQKSAELYAANRSLLKINKQLEKEVKAQAAETRILARLPEEIPDPVLRISRSGRITYTNTAYREQWAPVLELHTGDPYPALFQEAVEIAINTQAPYVAEFLLGDRKWSVQFNTVEQYGYVNILARDITEQKRAEEKIKKSQEALLETQELGNLGRWDLNLESATLKWSPQLFRQYGLDPVENEPEGGDIFMFVHPDDLNLVQKEVRKALNEGYSQFEQRVYRKDGVIRHLYTTVKCEYDHEKEPIRLYGTSLDVTELRQTEAQLRESEERFQLAMQGMNDGLWDCNYLQNTMYISPQWKSLLGYEDHELENTYETFTRFVHPKDLVRVRQLVLSAAVAPSVKLSYEFRIQHRDGTWRYMFTRCIVMSNSDGTLLRLVGSNADITEEIKAKQKLVTTVDQLKLLSKISFMFNAVSEDFEQAIQDAIEIIGRHTGVSRVYVFENSSDHVFASNTFEWCNEHTKATIEALQNVPYSTLAGLKKTLLKQQLLMADDSTLPSAVQAALLKEGVKSLLILPFFVREQFTGFVGFDDCQEHRQWDDADVELLRTFTNLLGSIFERQQAEYKVLQSEEKYRYLVDNLTEVIFQADKENRLTFLNPVWQEITGYDTEQSLGKEVSSFILKEDQKEFFSLQQLLYERKIDFCRHILRIKVQNGSIRYVEFFARLLEGKWGQTEGLSGTLSDVTEQQLSKKNLIKAKEMAEKASQAKAQFLSVMSHEIRTPLNAMLGISHLLLRQQPRPDQQENLRLLKFSGENLLSLINDILDFNKIESGKIVISKAPFDLRKLCNGLQKAQSIKANEKYIQLELTIAPEVPKLVSGDITRLTQILNNLLDNAIKFTHKGSVVLDIALLHQEEHTATLMFSVKDTGIGITQDSAEKMFETFTQVHKSSQHNYGGTGLGLAIIKRLLELLGSTIEVSSIPGTGSTFSFKLQVGLLDEQQGQKELLAEATPAQQRLEKASLLLVEDNPLNMLVLVQFFGLWGVQPDVAENGLQALQKISNKAYDLVLMDLHMPELDGIETTRRIRKDLALTSMPIIALTANALPGVRQQVLDAGMNDYLSKPFEPEELYQKVIHFLPQVNAASPLAAASSITESRLQDKHTEQAAPQELYSLHKLYQQSNNNPAFVERMVVLFIKTCSEQLVLIAQSRKQQQDDAIRDIVHKLKPSIDLFDIRSQLQAVRRLELMRLPELNSAEGTALLNNFIDCLQKVLVQMESWLREQAATKVS